MKNLWHQVWNIYYRHIWCFPSSLHSSILKMAAICSQDIVNELLHHLAQQTCIYQCHVTPAEIKVLILTNNQVQSVRLRRVLKFYYEAICFFLTYGTTISNQYFTHTSERKTVCSWNDTGHHIVHRCSKNLPVPNLHYYFSYWEYYYYVLQ
jgi:hypothetical protein